MSETPKPPPIVLLRATREEAAGAVLQVGGLRVIDRALRQLARQQVPRVVIATDGAIALPPWLATNVEVRQFAPDGELATRMLGLEAELGQPVTLRADVVRVRANHYDGGLRVVD